MRPWAIGGVPEFRPYYTAHERDISYQRVEDENPPLRKDECVEGARGGQIRYGKGNA